MVPANSQQMLPAVPYPTRVGAKLLISSELASLFLLSPTLCHAAAFQLWCLQKELLGREEARASQACALLERKRLQSIFQAWRSRSQEAVRVWSLVTQLQRKQTARYAGEGTVWGMAGLVWGVFFQESPDSSPTRTGPAWLETLGSVLGKAIPLYTHIYSEQ